MKFHEFGNKENPHIILIHGGGNAWWNYVRQARALAPQKGYNHGYLLVYLPDERLEIADAFFEDTD